MTLLLPDSNILSELVRVHANQKVLNRYYENLHHIGIAITVWHELWYGVYHMPEGKRQQMIADFINNNIARLPLYHYSKACADIHAKIRADCRKKGKTLSYADSQIASIALANQAILITRNTDDFQDIDGLVMQNWFE